MMLWGTWEELVLGGAVVRHGSHDWEVVALELSSRVASPSYFTPQVCKAKYEDLKKCYYGSSTWYEELRKRRVADLKRELEMSEDAIGSLESKVKRLKADRGCDTLADSPNTVIKSEDFEFSARGTPKDGLSAGSFTQDTRMNCLFECQIPAVTSILPSDIKPEISSSPEEGEYSNKNVEGNLKQLAVTIRRRRGKRKKKDSCDKGAEDVRIAASDNLGSTSAALSISRCEETSASKCNQALVSSGPDDHSRNSSTVKNGDDLMEIFTSIAQNELGTIFRHRLDSQKRARYKKIIKRHLDFGTLRSRLVDGSIKSVKELFRDLFLLVNNALVFYSKRTRAYKSAFSLRGIVKKAYPQHCENSYNKATSRLLSSSQCCRYAFLSNHPSKPRSARAHPQPCPHPHPCIEKPPLKFQCTNETETPRENEKLVDLDSNIPLRFLIGTKKSLKRRATVKGASSRTSRCKPSIKDKETSEQET